MEREQEEVQTLVRKDPKGPNNKMQFVDMEDLLRWTYAKQKADQVTRAASEMSNAELAAFGLNPQHVSACGCATLERISRLGTVIDGGGKIGARLHPDAETVHDCVMALCAHDRQIVIFHARTETVPDWLPDATVRLVPVKNSRGKPKMKWDSETKRPTACLVQHAIEPEFIRFARAEYSEWWNIISYLMEVLRESRKLITFYPNEFNRKETPWVS